MRLLAPHPSIGAQHGGKNFLHGFTASVALFVDA